MLYGGDAGVFAIPNGRAPKLVGRTPPEPFATDAAGDRVAAGAVQGCVQIGCAGPVKILSVPSGAVVGKAGGSKVVNTAPSLSPDGTQVVFARFPASDSGGGLGIWTASADGSHLNRIAASGGNPLWAPAGNRVAYIAPTNASAAALRLVPAEGGASSVLVPRIGSLFSWSPDGKRVAFTDAKARLAIVDVATRTVRTLLKLHPPYGASSIAWSPDSQQLLVMWKPPAHSDCPSGLWRVPANGAKPHLVHGC
jgi:Tol biopolymer transport system component